jgi:hypothetical protein
VRRAPRPRVAASTPTAVAPASPPRTDRLAAVDAAVARRDGPGCLAAVDALGDYARANEARAVCRMIAGECDAATRTLAATLGDAGAHAYADQYCPPGDDPSTRLRRLAAQTQHRTRFDCDHYLPIARAAARDARTDADRLAASNILATIAKCFGTSGRCDTARELWRDVVASNARWIGLAPDIGRDCE